MAQNLATYQLNATSVAARDAEYVTSGQFVGGVNRGGSNAGCIGLCTNVIDPKVDDWTTLDQAAAARTPQDSQHIGGDGLGAGDATVNPLNAIIDPHGTPDVNDTLSFIAAVVQAAPGAGFGTAGADPVNRSDRTVEIGERLWGTNTVA
jgi:hypothetical protein